jgi:ribosomal protein S18 acetylase RimI-like enzyme
MNDIEFRTLIQPADAAAVLPMMEALYVEDAGAHPDPAGFPLTIQTLLAEPSRGRIILFIEETALRGYAILIPYWSNEFGGTILFVDELFVVPEARSRGIGRKFFEFIFRQRPFDAIAAALEVSLTNVRARRLYESIGFRLRRNAMLACPIPAP